MLFTRLYCFCYYVYDTLIVYGIHFMFVCISIFNKNILGTWQYTIIMLMPTKNNKKKKKEKKEFVYYYIYINII